MELTFAVLPKLVFGKGGIYTTSENRAKRGLQSGQLPVGPTRKQVS